MLYSVLGSRYFDTLVLIGVDGRIILKWIIIKCDGSHRLDWSGSG